MSKLELVYLEGKRLDTDSLIMAEVFDEEHKNVLQDIRNQIKELEEAGELEFIRLNFQPSYYDDGTGRKLPKINMTDDAFFLVFMSYVTPEAMKMKVKFIEAFKRMDQELESLQPKLPQTYKEALLALIAVEEEKERLVEQARIEAQKEQAGEIEFSRLNFQQSNYTNERGRQYTKINMTEKGWI